MQLQARTLRALLAGQVPPTFHFVYVFRNISLGRHDGLIQFVDRRDRPRRVVWTGSIAAAWKEYVCRSTLTTVGLDAATWPPAMPPLRMLLQLRQGLRQYTFSAQRSCTCTREGFSRMPAPRPTLPSGYPAGNRRCTQKNYLSQGRSLGRRSMGTVGLDARRGADTRSSSGPSTGTLATVLPDSLGAAQVT